MKLISIASRFFVGIIFIFSGFVKVIDPLGSTYKFIDYFSAFGMPWLEFYAFPLAILLSAAEFIIGISLFVGIRMKIGSWATFLFMVFFTILTLFLAIFNPVTDCGCFGDAIILTNWQTFFKNILIIIPTILVFLYRKKFIQPFCNYVEWGIIGAFTILIMGLSVYGYNHLPLIGFRAYNVGTNIPKKMKTPDNAPQDEYESIFYYEKDGETKAFSADNYPWQDTTWKFINAEHNLVKKGYEPPIHDFIIESKESEDITDEVLNTEGYYFLIISYALDKANIEGIKKMNSLAEYNLQYNIPTICLTSSVPEDMEYITNEINPVFDFYSTDEITLKTIVRSNPGLVLLHEGTIIDKWHFNDISELDNHNANFIGKTLNKYKQKRNKLLVYTLILISILGLGTYSLLRSYIKKIWLIKS